MLCSVDAIIMSSSGVVAFPPGSENTAPPGFFFNRTKNRISYNLIGLYIIVILNCMAVQIAEITGIYGISFWIGHHYKKGLLKILTKKPLIASDKECESNSRSRSAKLRCAEKIL